MPICTAVLLVAVGTLRGGLCAGWRKFARHLALSHRIDCFGGAARRRSERRWLWALARIGLHGRHQLGARGEHGWIGHELGCRSGAERC